MVLKKKELIYKTETDARENILTVTKGERQEGGIDLECEINIYTLLHIK